MFGLAAMKVQFGLGFYAAAIISVASAILRRPGDDLATYFLLEADPGAADHDLDLHGIGLLIAAYERLAYLGIIRFDFFLSDSLR